MTVGDNYNSVLWNGTNWIVGSSVSTNNHLYASTPAGTWTAGATGSGQTVNLLAWDGTRHTTAEGTSFRYSTSNTLGTTTQISYPRPFNTQTQRRVKYYDNKLHYESGYYIYVTPATSLYWEHSTPIIDGIASPGSSAGTIQGNTGCLWVGAAGIIVASNVGKISTSF